MNENENLNPTQYTPPLYSSSFGKMYESFAVYDLNLLPSLSTSFPISSGLERHLFDVHSLNP